MGLANVVRAIDELLTAPAAPTADLAAAADRIRLRVNELHAQLVANDSTHSRVDRCLQRQGRDHYDGCLGLTYFAHGWVASSAWRWVT